MTAYCIFINTLLEGAVPSVRDALGRPYLFETELDAQREIADSALIRLQEFLGGERDYDDAISIEEYIVQVEVLPNGDINDNLGQRVI